MNRLPSSATAASTANRRRSIGGETTCRRWKRSVSGQPSGDGDGDDATRSASRRRRVASRRRRDRRAAATPTAIPAPSPLAIASTLTAYARELRGISSAATTATRKSRASPSGRPIVCVATRIGNVGATAPAAATSGAAKPTATITRAPPDAVGEGGDRQDEDDAGAHDRAGDADAGVADAEVVGGELDGLREQRVDERRRHRRGGEQAEHAELTRRQPIGRCPRTGCGGRAADRSSGRGRAGRSSSGSAARTASRTTAG